jgi:hypothetical protein
MMTVSKPVLIYDGMTGGERKRFIEEMGSVLLNWLSENREAIPEGDAVPGMDDLASRLLVLVRGHMPRNLHDSKQISLLPARNL